MIEDELAAAGVAEPAEWEVTGATEPEAPAPAPDAGNTDDGDRIRSLEPVVLDEPKPVLALVVIGVLTVSLLASLLWGLSVRSHNHSAATQRAAIERVSGQIVLAMTTYEYQNMGATRDRVLALATGTFAQQYRDGFGALQDLASQVHSSSTGTVKAVYVGDVSSHAASTLVDVELITSGANRVTRIGYYFTLSLLDVGGNWKVDNIVTLAYNPTSSTPGFGGAAPSTTTVPSK